MKRLLVLVSVAVAVASVSGCSVFRKKAPKPAAAAVSAKPAPQAAAGGPERVPFRVGVSSSTVEQLAKTHACVGGQGAGLMTEPGPIEVYRMQCGDGKVFMARCELRQCKKM